MLNMPRSRNTASAALSTEIEYGLASYRVRAESVVLQQNFRQVAERRFKGIVLTLWQRR